MSRTTTCRWVSSECGGSRLLRSVGAVVALTLTASAVAACEVSGQEHVSAVVTRTRLVGAHGVALAVPADWTAGLDVGSYCAATSPATVVFYLRVRGGIGSCAMADGAAWPAEDSLSVYTQFADLRVPPRRSPTGTVAGMDYYVATARDSGHGVARSLVVPQAGVEFLVGAATYEAADALLATIQRVPPSTYPVTLSSRGAWETPVLVNPGHRMISKVIEVHEPADVVGQLPGYLLRTEPPIGTPVAEGTKVTLVFSAGDLYGYAGRKAFLARGWHLADPHDFSPPTTRIQAFHAVPHKYPHGGGGGLYGIYLRQLNGRLVWLVALHDPTHETLRVTAIDAHSKAVVDDAVFPQVG